jgi:hypothetical protein
MERDMEPVSRDSVADDVEALLDKLIEKVGTEEVILGTEEAIRRIKAKAGTAKKKRRPPGFAYHRIDTRLLLLAWALRLEWANRLLPPLQPIDWAYSRPQYRGDPTQHALFKKVVDLCWDRKVAESFGIDFGPFPHLGMSKNAVVKRLMDRPWFIDMDLDNPDRGKDERHILDRRPSSEEWEAAHRQRPDLGLLPDGSTATNLSD